ncbi:hypothetical protein [Paenibacillus gansuensis]|uniref:Uncharacterized protein n=1 Tax=Paenibacillus gansuensis TaxID=306542 RepID=A0ABW5PFT1_9BACL
MVKENLEDGIPPKGHVEFHEPTKVVAARPEDAESESELNEMRLNDGYPGSCGIQK